jgi:predicted N-acetyltransferase YhbS
MRHSFREADFDALTSLWNEFFAERYHVDPAILRFNTVESPTFDWGASGIAGDPKAPTAFLVVKKSPASLYRGPDPDQAHLACVAYRGVNEAIDLMADAKRMLINRGICRIQFGRDSRHFFPGCPTDCGNLRDFLMIEGFVGDDEQVDLERDLGSYKNTFEMPEGCEARPVQPDDVPFLTGFLDREFPGRWAYDVRQKMELEGRCDFVHGLFRDGKIVGFALLQDSSHRCPIGGAVWRRDLGEDWGSLGPIGVGRAERAKGCGHALLGASLERLRDCGIRRCIVDWTTLKSFYGRHGFEPARTYEGKALGL